MAEGSCVEPLGTPPQPAGMAHSCCECSALHLTSLPSQSETPEEIKAMHGHSADQDYVVVVSHADFLNSLIQRLLKLQDPPKYAFRLVSPPVLLLKRRRVRLRYTLFHENTGVTHLHIDFKEREEDEPVKSKWFARVTALPCARTHALMCRPILCCTDPHN